MTGFNEGYEAAVQQVLKEILTCPPEKHDSEYLECLDDTLLLLSLMSGEEQIDGFGPAETCAEIDVRQRTTEFWIPELRNETVEESKKIPYTLTDYTVSPGPNFWLPSDEERKNVKAGMLCQLTFD